jgi:hypothetical protein
MWVRLPYLAAFGTIASLYKNCVSFIPEETKEGGYGRACQMSDGKEAVGALHHPNTLSSARPSSFVPGDRVHCLGID